MIALWVAAGVLSAAGAGLVLHRAARAALNAGSADPTLEIYRRQLDEIDALTTGGVLDERERKAAHAEAGRRLLSAADQTPQVWNIEPGHQRLVLGAAVGAALAALGLYLALGAPNFPDQPIKRRIAQWRTADLASLTAPQMAAVLRQATAANPDPEGYRFLALAESQSGDPSGAARALRKGLKLAPQRSDLWEMLGLTLVDQAGGEDSASAVIAFRQAVALDPHAAAARFHLARAQAQAGDRTGAVLSLQALLADLAPSDPRRADLTAAIAQAQGPAPAAAPTGGQVEIIRGMVAGLAARLKSNPDDAEGWVRLVRSYAVLGDGSARDATLTQAQVRYRDRADVLHQLALAAKTEPMR